MSGDEVTFPLGMRVERTQYSTGHVIGGLVHTLAGNTSIRVGEQHNGSWVQTHFITITPAERALLIRELLKDTQTSLLETLVAEGLTFGEVLSAFAARNDERAEAYITGAREHWAEDGAIEIDSNAITSGSEGPGDYVLAWVWVTNGQAGLDDEDDDAGDDEEENA